MVRLQTLDLRIGVRVPASQPTFAMKTLAFSSLLLISGLTAFGQNPSELFDKAPPAIDEALRARIDKFYGAFIAGKFKDAYLMVADDSQDKFFELPKEQYKGCEIVKINYSENFTKAVVVTSCKTDWKFHGSTVLTTFPLTSNWEVIDSEWVWHYVKPSMVPSPFSPTGFVPVPTDSTPNPAALVPKDIPAAAKAILARVTIDKASVRLRSDETSQDVVHVRNDMQGQVSLVLNKPDLAGLNISVAKNVLKAHEETTIVFEWRLDDTSKKMNGRTTVQLRIVPTGQVFPINIDFENAPPH
jgi:hypothetical protein